MRLISAKQCSIHVSRARYMIKSADEWATTKQACRDKRVVF